MVDRTPSSAACVLVVGATGLVGREVVTALCARGIRPRVLLRSADRASALPPGVDVEVVVGDLDDRTSLDVAPDGVDAALLTTPHDEREAALGLAFLAACEPAGMARLVLSTASHPDTSNRLVRDAVFWVMGRIGPHYAAKYRVEAAVRDSALDSVVLQPTNFSQNDLLWRRELLEGSYPQPLGAKGANQADRWATYQLILRLGLSARAGQLVATRTALGREPQDYETFVCHTVEQWSS